MFSGEKLLKMILKQFVKGMAGDIGRWLTKKHIPMYKNDLQLETDPVFRNRHIIMMEIKFENVTSTRLIAFCYASIIPTSSN